MNLFTIGYTGAKLSAIQSLLERENLLLVDTRFSPNSRAPQWNRGRLQESLGDRYAWIKAFGNANYKSGPIAIVNMPEGIAHVERAITSGFSGVLLLCACADLSTCHRRVVSEALERHFEVTATHLNPKDLTDDPAPPATPDWGQMLLL